jgi:PAS domain S-box-containing protein
MRIQRAQGLDGFPRRERNNRPMKEQTRRFWWRTLQCLLGSIGLALLTFIAFRLQASPAMAALLYFFLIVLFSMWAGFLPSLFVSVLAILCFDYFFTEPIFRLRLREPIDLIALIVFTSTALIVARLISGIRERTASLKQTNEQLRAQIIERTRVEEKVWQSEEELRRLIDVIPQQVFVFDSNWTPLFANRRELEYTGLTLQEAQSKDAVAKIFHPEDLKKLEVFRERMGSEGAEMEARIRGKDGRYRWFLIRDSSLLDEHGRVLRWYGTRTDIEDRKQAEEALRQSEQQLRDKEEQTRQIIDVIPQQVFVFSADWTPLFANQRELEYTGLSPQEAQSKDAVAKIFHPEDFKKLEVLRERMGSEGTPFEMEARIRGNDGQYRWFLIRDNSLRDEQGRVVRWYGTRTDIEDRKRAEEGYSKAQAELAHITRVMTMGELAASIAHEVNQPLSGVVINGNTCLRWLAANPPNLDEAREAARRIVRDGKRAGDVVARIRALATKSSSNKERVDINEAIQDVVGLTRDEVRGKHVRLKTELADGLPPVMGDRVQLQQVLLNLVMNGVDAMSAVEGRDRELVIKAQNDEGGQVRVEVRDCGVGLNEESIQKIFNPFYSTKPAGMGMGLSISRSIIQNYGGRIWATLNDGPGTTFHFTVPKWQ